MADAGRTRHPYILTDLRSHCKLWILPAGKQQVGSHRHLSILPVCHNRCFHARREMTQLIELRVVRHIGFCYQAKQFSIADGCCHVVKLALMFPGKAGKNQHFLFFCELHKVFQFFSDLLQQNLLQKQVIAGISGKAQLREHQKLHALPFVFFYNTAYHLTVMNRICDFNLWCGCRCADKAISHISFLLTECIGCSSCQISAYYCRQYNISCTKNKA